MYMLMRTLMCLKKLVVHWLVQASVYAHMQAGNVMLPVLSIWLLHNQHGCHQLIDLHLA